MISVVISSHLEAPIHLETPILSNNILESPGEDNETQSAIGDSGLSEIGDGSR